MKDCCYFFFFKTRGGRGNRQKDEESKPAERRRRREGQNHQADFCSLPAGLLLCTGNVSVQPEGEEVEVKGLQTAVPSMGTWGHGLRGEEGAGEEGSPW